MMLLGRECALVVQVVRNAILITSVFLLYGCNSSPARNGPLAAVADSVLPVASSKKCVTDNYPVGDRTFTLVEGCRGIKGDTSILIAQALETGVVRDVIRSWLLPKHLPQIEIEKLVSQISQQSGLSGIKLCYGDDTNDEGYQWRHNEYYVVVAHDPRFRMIQWGYHLGTPRYDESCVPVKKDSMKKYTRPVGGV